MKIRYLLFGLICFTMMGGPTAFAQDDLDNYSNPLEIAGKPSAIYFGLSVGYNRVLHSAELKTFAEDLSCPVFQDGKASGFHVGGFYEQFIGEKGTQHSVILRGLYNTFPASFTQQGDKQPSMARLPEIPGHLPERDSMVWSTSMNSNEIKYTAISLDLMYKFRAVDIQDVGGLVFTIGPTFDLINTKTRSQKLELLETNVQFVPQPGKVYSPDNRTIIVFDGEIENAQSLRFAIKAGVQMELKIPGVPIDIIPGAFYNFAFTNVDDRDWKVNAIQIGVDLRYALKITI